MVCWWLLVSTRSPCFSSMNFIHPSWFAGSYCWFRNLQKEGSLLIIHPSIHPSLPPSSLSLPPLSLCAGGSCFANGLERSSDEWGPRGSGERCFLADGKKTCHHRRTNLDWGSGKNIEIIAWKNIEIIRKLWKSVMRFQSPTIHNTFPKFQSWVCLTFCSPPRVALVEVVALSPYPPHELTLCFSWHLEVCRRFLQNGGSPHTEEEALLLPVGRWAWYLPACPRPQTFPQYKHQLIGKSSHYHRHHHHPHLQILLFVFLFLFFFFSSSSSSSSSSSRNKSCLPYYSFPQEPC